MSRVWVSLGLVLLTASCGVGSHGDGGAVSSAGGTSSDSRTQAPERVVPGDTLSAAVPQEAFATPADPSVPIDVPTAERVFRALYPLRSEAVYEHRADVLKTIETGAALEYDLAQCRSRCEEPLPVGPEVAHTFSAPPQAGYPAFFYARAANKDVDGVPANELIVFTRSSPKEPWLIALNNATGEALPVFADGNANFGRPVPQAPGPAPAALPAAFAAFLQHWFEHGVAPPDHPFLLPPYLQDRVSAIAKTPSEIAKRGEQETRRYIPDGTTFVTAADQGRVYVCGAIRLEQHVTPAPAKNAIVQPADLSNFGRLLAPGRYRDLAVRGIEEVCFLIPSDGRSLATFTPNVDISVTGTPA